MSMVLGGTMARARGTAHDGRQLEWEAYTHGAGRVAEGRHELP